MPTKEKEKLMLFLKNQSGVSIIAAIFIIVILAFMGMVFLTLLTTTQTTTINELQSTRALYVAEGGMERGIRYFTSPTLTERIACASIPATNTSLGSGQFSLSIEAGSPFYLTNAPTLSASILAATPSPIDYIQISSSNGLAPFGRVMIDKELFDYTSISSIAAECGGSQPCLRGVIRARDGTTAASHAGPPNAARVGQDQCTVTSTGGVYNLTTPNARRQVREGIQLQEGWAVGNRVGGGMGGASEVILRWDGVNWTRMAVLGSIPDTTLRSVSMLSYADGWAVGNVSGGNEVILRWTGGPDWTRVGPLATIANRNLNDIYCVSTNDCWAVGDAGGAGERPWILRWNGAWATYDSSALNINTTLNSVYCVASNDCWIVGNDDGNEVILRWLGGPNWTRVGPSALIPDIDLNSIHCINSNDCWIVGDQSGGEMLLHWDGSTWSRVTPVGSIPNVNLRSVNLIGPKQRPQAMWREVFQ